MILISPSTVIRLDADVANSTTTLANATGLSFTAAANADYLIEAFLVYTSAATTTGLNLAISGPASPAGVVGDWRAYTSATAALLRQFTAYDTGTPTTGVLAAGAAQYADFRAMLRTGAAGGAVTLRFASEVAASAITLKAGSLLRVQQTAPVSTVNTIERFYAVVQLCQNLSTMQNNMRQNVQAIKASKDAGTIPTFAAAQQAMRDLGTAFLQRLALNEAVVTPRVTEVTDGAAALGILFSDMTTRYNLLNTWATTLSTATITNQTDLDNSVTAVLAAVPASMLPF
ncbi:MAG TPA: hypothetical protein VJ816_08205 [Gemmatimonadales bacterium]|nr:hypothetical protein [Gemmatimonadales bacterium]